MNIIKREINYIVFGTKFQVDYNLHLNEQSQAKLANYIIGILVSRNVCFLEQIKFYYSGNIIEDSIVLENFKEKKKISC